jgi:hypothetical protein
MIMTSAKGEPLTEAEKYKLAGDVLSIISGADGAYKLGQYIKETIPSYVNPAASGTGAKPAKLPPAVSGGLGAVGAVGSLAGGASSTVSAVDNFEKGDTANGIMDSVTAGASYTSGVAGGVSAAMTAGLIASGPLAPLVAAGAAGVALVTEVVQGIINDPIAHWNETPEQTEARKDLYDQQAAEEEANAPPEGTWAAWVDDTKDFNT